jgi:hypothetical protein
MDSVPDLKLAVEVAHGFIAIHLYSVPVRLPLTHDQIWRGVVEVFMILGHPATKTVCVDGAPRRPRKCPESHHHAASSARGLSTVSSAAKSVDLELVTVRVAGLLIRHMKRGKRPLTYMFPFGLL